MLTAPWLDYFTAQSNLISQMPARIQTVSVAQQSASIGATDMSNGSLSAGLYLIQYYARITQAATTSSSLEVVFDWTDGGVTPVYTGAAMTGNTTSTFQSGSLMVEVDALSPIRYSTIYASVGGTVMEYKLVVVLSEVSA